MTDLFSTLVVGVDDSEPSKAAVRYAARLAREHRGTLVLCHCVNWTSVVAPLEVGVPFDPTSIIDFMKEQGAALLLVAAAAAQNDGVVARRVLAEGEPAEALMAAAKEAGGSVVVMGTHGRRGLGRAVTGSTTEAVLRASDLPVLTLREEPPALPGERALGRVLVAVDDSEPSDAAVQLALRLPPEDRRHLGFVSVVDVDRVLGSSRYSNPAIRDELCAAATRTIDAAVDAARAAGVEADASILEGHAGDVVLAAAREDRADLIVMGSHGRRGLRRFFLGSVAESVVRNAAVAVLVVRAAPS